jgi:hypothetical protein
MITDGRIKNQYNAGAHTSPDTDAAMEAATIRRSKVSVQTRTEYRSLSHALKGGREGGREGGSEGITNRNSLLGQRYQMVQRWETRMDDFGWWWMMVLTTREPTAPGPKSWSELIIAISSRERVVTRQTAPSATRTERRHVIAAIVLEQQLS